MPCYEASDLVLHCLPMFHKKDNRLNWVNFLDAGQVAVKIFQGSWKHYGSIHAIVELNSYPASVDLSSADNFYKQFGHRSGPTERRS